MPSPPTRHIPARCRRTISAAVEKAVPDAKIGTTLQTAYGGVAATVPANSVADLLNVPGVAAVQQDTLEQPQDDNTEFIGATAVWPSLGGSLDGRLERRRRRHRHGHLARASDARRRLASRRSGRRPQGLPVRSTAATSRISARRSPATTSSSAPTRSPTRTWPTSAPTRARSSATTRPTSCSPRDSEGHGTHTLDDGRGRLCRLGRALRRRARPGLRYRTRRARDRVSRLPPAGLLRLRLGRGRAAGDHATAST